MAEKYVNNEQNDKIEKYILEPTKKEEELDKEAENMDLSSSEVDSKRNISTCKICLEELDKMVCKLDQCGHIFCKECLIRYINNTDDKVEIKCPSCDFMITESIIKEVLGDKSEDFESKRKAQLELSNNKISSLLMNDNKTQEPRDQDEIEALIKTGLMMRCPRCSALLEKIDSGCQFIRCFMCKLDICYITRQPRWGPNGKGDTTGGCQCGVGGKKCHPDCTNCH